MMNREIEIRYAYHARISKKEDVHAAYASIYDHLDNLGKIIVSLEEIERKL